MKKKKSKSEPGHWVKIEFVYKKVIKKVLKKFFFTNT